ncbi:uncharacterized protein PAF06_000763 [Gastrophryne carolinensis]
MESSKLFVLRILWDLGHWAAGICLLCLLYKASKLYVKWKELKAALSPFAGPKRHWLFGNAHEFHGDGKDLDIIMRYAEQYPYAYPLWMGNFYGVLTICHPDYAKSILSRQDPKDNFGYYFLTSWIGKGLLVLSGPKWFQHRRLLTPGFHYDVLKPYVKLTSDCVNVMLDKWERLIPEKKPVELFHHVSLMTLDTIMKCAFGYQSNCQHDSESAYIKAVYDLTYLVDYRFGCLPYHSDLIFHLSPHGFRYRRALRTAHQHTDKVIKLRKALLKDETELEKIQQKRHLDFLDILLCAKDENGKGLSDEDLRAEVDTFMFEGHDTTASGISWALYCMAKYPEHQEKCREEIREVLGDRNFVQWEDLNKLPYTTMCLKESMRLYPPVPGVARELTSPITFCDGRSLPKGSQVLLSIFTINRCSSIWEDPEVFDPLRFSPENSSHRHSHAFLPFSAGSRNCIGQNFAMNEMKVALALTLQRFELHPDPDNDPLILPQLVLRSLNGIYLNLKKINRKIAEQFNYFRHDLDKIWDRTGENERRIGEAEDRLSVQAGELATLRRQVTVLLGRAEDSENRNRRNNLKERRLDMVTENAQKYDYGFTLWLGSFETNFSICHPDYAKTILSRQDPKDNFGYRFITPWIGNGLLVSSGPKWHQHRRLLTPGFHYDVLKPYVKLTSDCVNVMLDKWDQLPEEKPVELFHYVSLMTLDTIMKCAFSYQSNCQNDSESEYIKAVYALSELTDYRFHFAPYHNDLIFNLSPHGFRFRKALRIAHEHTAKVIKLRKESLKQETELEKIKQKRHLDFLDILLCAKYENGKGLSDEDLRAEVDTFMFEGHDTTACGISWTLYCMAKYPEHQEKCREEIRNVLGDRDILAWEDLSKMPYTTMCIKESMRLYPPVPGIGRELTSPVTFCDGRSLPKGARIILSIYAMNRNASVWDNPEVFDPSRFAPENTSSRNAFSFIPFSAGSRINKMNCIILYSTSRNCIGQSFAMNEMKVALSLILKRFQLSADPNNEPIKIPHLVGREPGDIAAMGFSLISELNISEGVRWVGGIFLLFVLFQAASLYLRRRHLLRTFSPFPGPEKHWLYGTANVLKSEGWDLDVVAEFAGRYEYAFPLWLGQFFCTLTICNPEYAKIILSRQDPKDNFAYYFLTQWIGKGLLVLSGKKWFQHRRMLTPGFHYDVLKPYLKVMTDCTNVMLDKLDQLASDKKPVELFHHVSLMTLDTIMKCAFSNQSNCQLDSESEYIKAVYELCYLVDHRTRTFPYHSDLIFNLSPHGWRFRRALKIANEHTTKVIKQRKESLNKETELEKIKQKRRLDFLDILLFAKDENGKGLSDEDLKAEVDTFMFEGHDTTASGISWALYCMAKYPEHQEKCRQEIREVLGDRDTLEWDDVGKLPYTTMCIRESMRLYPPVTGVARELTSPVTFPDGRSLPKGTNVLLGIYAMNRSPFVWENPEVYDPMRFSPENSLDRHPFGFIPFSAGSRNCIGQNFAMNELKIALALTLQRFELRPDHSQEPKKSPQLVLRSLNGIHVYLKKIPQNK